MKVEPNINLGQILQIVSLVTVVISATFWLNSQFHNLDLRVSGIEATLNHLADVDDRLDDLERDVALLKQN